MSQLQLNFLTRIVPELENGEASCATYVDSTLEKNKWKDKPCKSIEDIVSLVNANSDLGRQTYYAMSAFKQGWHKVEEHGRLVSRFRTKENTTRQKALWLDIDCGKPGSKYPDLTTAVGELLRFTTETQLPAPLVVISGVGLHVYWPFEKAVDKITWQAMADALELLCHGYKLLDVDPALTTRVQGVLRVPETYNYKTDPALKVELLDWGVVSDPYDLAGIIHTALGNNASCGYLGPSGSIIGPPGVLMDTGAFADASEYLHRPKMADDMLAECPQLLDMGFNDQPAWYSAMAVLKFCEDGFAWVNKLSALCPEKYNEEQVQYYFDTAVNANTGPTLCSTFNQLTPGVCSECRHWNSINTPLQLAAYKKNYIVDRAPLITNFRGENQVRVEMPDQKFEVFQDEEFKVVPGVGCYWMPLTKDGKSRNDFFINHNEIYIHAQRVEQSETGIKRYYVIRRKCRGFPSVDCVFSVDHDWDKKSRWLAHNGLLPVSPRKHLSAMEDMMSTMMSKMRHYLPEISTQKHFGWNYSHDNYEGFILGDKLYSEKGTHLVSLDTRASQQFTQDFRSDGTLEEWKKLPDLYRQLDQQTGQLFMCAAFASPFMKFGGNTATNMVLSIWDSRGGKGKTTLLRMVNSVWGHPKLMMSKHNDTISARYQTLGTRKNLPLCVDELTMMGDDDLANLILDLANGIQYRKSRSGGESLQETAQWDTITFVSSNRSIYELMNMRNSQTTAEEMRVVEVQCKFPSYSGSKIGAFLESTLRLMDSNYGVAGAYFLEQCFKNPDVFIQVKEEAEDFDLRMRKDSSERYWTYGMGLVLAVGRLCVQWGILNYDMNALENYVCQEVLASGRNHINSSRVDSYLTLNEYFTEQMNNTLIVKEARRPKGSRDLSLKEPLMDDYAARIPRDQLNVRMELDTMDIYIRHKQFQLWCKHNKISAAGVMNDLVPHGIWHPDKGRVSYILGRGVQSMDKGQILSYKINGAKLQEVSGDIPIRLLGTADE